MPIRRFRKGTYNSYFKRKMSRRGKYGRRRARANLKAIVTKVLMKKAETKYYDIATENRQLYHNLGGNGTSIPLSVTSLTPWFNPWANIAEGSRRYERIGDKITPRGMSLKIYLANKSDRPNTMIRVIVAVLPKVVATTITTQQFDPFQIANGGLCGNNMLLPADHDIGVRFLYDRIHRMGNMQTPFNSAGGGGAKEMTKQIKLWIKRKRSRDIVYNSEDNTIVNKPLAVYAIPYEQYSTLTTDNIASLGGFMRMYYKDV